MGRGHKIVSFAKITCPHYSNILKRKRLFTLLDKSFKHYPILHVTAPGGSGKTTLLSSYLCARKRPCLWYSIGSGDDDIATFFYYMGLAVKKAAPRKKKPMPCLTPEYRKGIAVFTRRYFEEVYSRLKAPACLVFDNYHEASQDSPLHNIILGGIELIPDGVHVIFLSRNNPPSAFSRLRANNHMGIVGWDEICLTQDETLGIMQLYGIKGKYSKEAAQEIYSKTRGWAAGVHLMLAPIKKGIINAFAAQDITMATVFDYFDSEILEGLDADKKKFLLKAALLPQMDAQSAEKLTGISNAGEILEEFNRKNCFTEKRNALNPTYQYHPLFREFLLSRINNFFPLPEKRELQIKAARILSESEKYEDAFTLFKDAEDWNNLADFILKHSQTLLLQGRGAIVEAWIQSIPQHMLDKTPWLLYWLGMSRLSRNPVMARPHLEQAFHLFHERKDASGAFLAWSGIIDTFLLEWNNFTPLGHWIEVCNRLIDAYKTFPSPAIEAQVTANMFYAMVMHDPHNPDIDKWEQRTRVILKNSLGSSQQITNFISKGYYIITYYYTAWLGEMEKARTALEELRPIVHASSPMSKVMWHMSEACYQWTGGSFDACDATVVNALELARVSGISLLNPRLLSHALFGVITTGDHEKTAEYLKAMEAGFDKEHTLELSRCIWHILAGSETLNKGDVQDAVNHAQIAIDMATNGGVPFLEAVARVVKAEALIGAGDMEEAGHCLAKAGAGFQKNSKSGKHMCALVSASLEMALGDDEKCLEAIRTAMELASKNSFMFLFFVPPHVMARLCAKALEAGIEPFYVQDIIRKRKLAPEKPMANWPYQFKMYTLGQWKILRDNKPVQFAKKEQKKPIELLQALVAFGGRDVKNEKFIDSIWADSDGDVAANNFRSTLHRLRKLMGSDRAIISGGGNISLEPGFCWVDIFALENCMEEIDALVSLSNHSAGPSKKQASQIVNLADKALSLHKGDFLPDADLPWAVRFRNKARSRFTSQLERLGKYFESAGKKDYADKCYKRARKGA